MNRYLRMAFVYIKYNIKWQTAYKKSFIMNFISQFVSYAVDFGLMWIMVNSFGNMNSWNKYEVMLLYAMSLASYAIGGAFFFNISLDMPKQIHSGEFDDFLIKPLNLLPYLISRNFLIGYISHLTLSITMIAICFVNIGLRLTVLEMLFFIFSVLSGAVIYSALFLLISIPAFFTTKLESLRGIVFFFRQMSYYPLSIFPKALQVLLTFIIPYGMINFFPVQAVIRKNDILMFGPYIKYVAPLFAAGLFTLSVFLFNLGVRRYKSTGS